MEEILKDISSINWWFGVVIVGILINLFSAYAKPSLDKIFANRSKTKRRKFEEKEANIANLSEKLKASQESRYTFHLELLEQRLESIFILAIGIIVLLTSRSSTLPYLSEAASFLSLFFMLSSMRSMVKYHQMKTILLKSKF